jgi:hypothetical protein
LGAGKDDGPIVRPRADQTAPRGAKGQPLVPIGPGRGVGGTRSGPRDPYKFWADYYKKHDESAAQLRETLALLNASGKFTDVHAALLGYLTQRKRNAEPWMYEALAMAVEMVKGRPEDIKTALNYAADLAQKTHNPNHLVSVADKLILKGYLERVGPLLDEAAAKIPHRAEPLIMSINLAQQSKDPRRMASSIDRLLSLGWPGRDDYFRQEARNQAERLAKALRAEDRAKEAETLLNQVSQAEARDVFVRLTWDGEADFDLVVEEPLGAFAQYSTPRTVFGGALIKNGYGNHPEEIYTCPRGFNGDYTIRISKIFASDKNPPTRLSLETITHEGTAREKKDVRSLVPDDPDAKPVVIHLADGRRKTVLPFLNPATLMELMTGTARPSEKKSDDKKPGLPSPAARPAPERSTRR